MLHPAIEGRATNPEKEEAETHHDRKVARAHHPILQRLPPLRKSTQPSNKISRALTSS